MCQSCLGTVGHGREETIIGGLNVISHENGSDIPSELISAQITSPWMWQEAAKLIIFMSHDDHPGCSGALGHAGNILSKVKVPGCVMDYNGFSRVIHGYTTFRIVVTIMFDDMTINCNNSPLRIVNMEIEHKGR